MNFNANHPTNDSVAPKKKTTVLALASLNIASIEDAEKILSYEVDNHDSIKTFSELALPHINTDDNDLFSGLVQPNEPVLALASLNIAPSIEDHSYEVDNHDSIETFSKLALPHINTIVAIALLSAIATIGVVVIKVRQKPMNKENEVATGGEEYQNKPSEAHPLPFKFLNLNEEMKLVKQQAYDFYKEAVNYVEQQERTAASRTAALEAFLKAEKGFREALRLCKSARDSCRQEILKLYRSTDQGIISQADADSMEGELKRYDSMEGELKREKKELLMMINKSRDNILYRIKKSLFGYKGDTVTFIGKSEGYTELSLDKRYVLESVEVEVSCTRYTLEDIDGTFGYNSVLFKLDPKVVKDRKAVRENLEPLPEDSDEEAQ